jgi:hypothetical protein
MVRMFAILCTDKRYLSGSYQFVAGNAADRTSTESPMPDVVAFDAGAPFQQVIKPCLGLVRCHGYHNVSLYRAVAPNLRHPKQGFLVSA